MRDNKISCTDEKSKEENINEVASPGSEAYFSIEAQDEKAIKAIRECNIPDASRIEDILRRLPYVRLGDLLGCASTRLIMITEDLKEEVIPVDLIVGTCHAEGINNWGPWQDSEGSLIRDWMQVLQSGGKTERRSVTVIELGGLYFLSDGFLLVKALKSFNVEGLVVPAAVFTPPKRFSLDVEWNRHFLEKQRRAGYWRGCWKRWESRAEIESYLLPEAFAKDPEAAKQLYKSMRPDLYGTWGSKLQLLKKLRNRLCWYVQQPGEAVREIMRNTLKNIIDDA